MVSLCLLNGNMRGQVMAGQPYDDAVTTDYTSIVAAGNSLPSNNRDGMSLMGIRIPGSRTFATDYLAAVRSSASWNGDAAFSLNPLTASWNPLAPWRTVAPEASTAFQGLVRDLGLDSSNALRDQMFTTAFNGAYSQPSDLANPTVARLALQVALQATVDLSSPAVMRAAIASTDPRLNEMGTLRQRELDAQEAARAAGIPVPPLTPAPLRPEQRETLFNALLQKNYNDPSLYPAPVAEIQQNVEAARTVERNLEDNGVLVTVNPNGTADPNFNSPTPRVNRLPGIDY